MNPDLIWDLSDRLKEIGLSWPQICSIPPHVKQSFLCGEVLIWVVSTNEKCKCCGDQKVFCGIAPAVKSLRKLYEK